MMHVAVALIFDRDCAEVRGDHFHRICEVGAVRRKTCRLDGVDY